MTLAFLQQGVHYTYSLIGYDEVNLMKIPNTTMSSRPQATLFAGSTIQQSSVGLPLPKDFCELTEVRPSELAANCERVTITGSKDINQVDVRRLKATALQAIAYFEEHFGKVASPLRFKVGQASKALRTGYDVVNDVVGLPALDSVLHAGLDSVDVLNHEIFHALVIKAFPNLPVLDEASGSDTISLHEALADLFAYRLNPDAHFGEAYYKDRQSIREYHTPLRLGLASGSHAQGNALTAMLLAADVSNKEIRGFLEAGDFTLDGLANHAPRLGEALAKEEALAVEETVSSHPPSRRRSYWLDPNKPLEIAFTPTESLLAEYPEFRIVWRTKSGEPSQDFQFEPQGAHGFLVHGMTKGATEKVMACFQDGDAVIGFRPFYFGTRKA